MSNQHTPGPWTYDTDDLGTWINSPACPAPIAKMGKATVLPTQANARLITAAPDLLFALNALVAWQAESRHAVPLSYLEGAKAAIDKAEGRS